MSRVVSNFMDQWLLKNVHFGGHLDKVFFDLEANALAIQCVVDAQAAGVATQKLEEEFGDLSSFMRETLQRLADKKVEHNTAGATDEASHAA